MVKKSHSSHKKHKSEKKHTASFYMGIFIVFIMITSMFGVMFYGFTSPDQTATYNDYKFKTTQQGYSLEINDKIHYFNYLPQDTEDIEINPGIIEKINNAEMIIVTSDPDSSYIQEIAIASYDLNINFMENNIPSGNAFTSKNGNLPVVTCLNATESSPVINIVEGNETKAELEENCINIIFDTSFNLERIKTKLIYQIYGVMNAE